MLHDEPRCRVPALGAAEKLDQQSEPTSLRSKITAPAAGLLFGFATVLGAGVILFNSSRCFTPSARATKQRARMVEVFALAPAPNAELSDELP